MRSSRIFIFRLTVSFEPDFTSRALRHERVIVAAGIAAISALAWWFLLSGGGMGRDDGMTAMAEPPFAALLIMWWLMMAAMMLPSTAPAILLYARVRAMRAGDGAIARSWVFLAGYLMLWFAFSLIAAGAHHVFGLPSANPDSPTTSLLLIVAGAYQLSPLKNACLGECRSPALFIGRHWRPGWSGALRLGLLHGAYCVGCCWALMLLLFVGGVMNLAWVVALAVIVAAEKLVPYGLWLSRIIGIALITWGVGRLLA